MMKEKLAKLNQAAWKQHSVIKNLLTLISLREPETVVTKKEGTALSNDYEPSPTYSAAQKIGLVCGPLLFILLMFVLNLEGVSQEGRAVLATTAWMAAWWITEALPIPVTSLLPIILFPLTGAMELGVTASTYSSDIIFLFLGGFFLAIAIEKWNLHRRIALSIIRMVGTSPERLVLGLVISTGFISMWISSTATTLMMVPIATAITLKFSEMVDKNEMYNQEAEDTKRKFGKVLMLTVSYASLTAGMATLIGTPANALFAGYVKEAYGIEISFAKWMLVGTPIAIICTTLVYFMLVKVLFPLPIKELPGGSEIIESELKEMGPMTREEKMVGTVFVLTALSWMTRSLVLQPFVSPFIDDAIIAMIATFILFMLPSKQSPGETLLTWSSASKLPWGILILFGGGLAIGAGFSKSGLTEWVGAQLVSLSTLPVLSIVFLIIFLVIFLSEVTSNTALATVLIPVMGSLAAAIGIDPLGLLLATTLAATTAFMLPTGTPPNAIVFSSGKLTIREMMRAGFLLNILCAIILTAFIYWYVPLVWGINL
ncbi:DASS family sodium-coupled anion symporter [Peribacillus frigoritolerans]|uniref:SLC13 family permease n=1 Tax=Peribacillus frigoritolerans TaxID=450367 RepID=UPI002E1ACC4A|nr:DASS family sodium-coupled anion symporter [Peribacillus frigoritolerans]MED4695905.1 DASS family sodium-coupled anion symporter [Peribacillus frigoritolerans]